MKKKIYVVTGTRYFKDGVDVRMLGITSDLEEVDKIICGEEFNYAITVFAYSEDGGTELLQYPEGEIGGPYQLAYYEVRRNNI